MPIKMPMISSCDVTNCSYNTDKKCHTMAITVGDSSCAICDTYIDSRSKGGDQAVTGGVGACKAMSCKWNQSLECTAGNIVVGVHSSHADCKTYSAR
jgi:hypothetical protein